MAGRRQPGRRAMASHLAALVAAIAPGPARADPMPIALEVYEGERPADADRLVGPVIAELRRHRVLAGVDAVGMGYELFQSQPGIAVPEAELERLADRARRGFEEWTQARYAEAVAILERVVAMARDAPAALILQERLRRAYRKSLVGLALAHHRLGHRREAAETMAELVRSVPDIPLEPMEFGLEAFELYREVRASLAALGTGVLSVRVDDPEAIVFVNEQYVARPAEGRALVPGSYRVLVRKGDRVGRVHRAVVQAGKTASVDVLWAMDQALHTSPDWTGFAFPGAAARRDLLPGYARAFARVMRTTTVVAVGIGGGPTGRSIVGQVFRVDGSGPLRALSLAIGPVPPGQAQLRALGAYLAGAGPAPTVSEPTAVSVAPAPPASRPIGATSRALLSSSLVAGAAAIGVGAYLLRIDGQGTCDSDQATCPDVYTTGTGGRITILAGATAVIVPAAVWLWRARRGHPSRRVSLSVGTAGAATGVALGGEF